MGVTNDERRARALDLFEGTLRALLGVEDDGTVADYWLGTNFIAMLDQLGWGVAPCGETVPV